MELDPEEAVITAYIEGFVYPIPLGEWSLSPIESVELWDCHGSR